MFILDMFDIYCILLLIQLLKEMSRNGFPGRAFKVVYLDTYNRDCIVLYNTMQLILHCTIIVIKLWKEINSKRISYAFNVIYLYAQCRYVTVIILYFIVEATVQRKDSRRISRHYF